MKIIFTLVSLAMLAGISLAGDLTFAYPFPNPYKPSLGHTTTTFTNLADTCTIKIFSTMGEVVKSISITGGNGQSVWDVKNDAGENLASGIYFYYIKSATDSKVGKLVVIR